jgi:hypothetical protein
MKRNLLLEQETLSPRIAIWWLTMIFAVTLPTLPLVFWIASTGTLCGLVLEPS